MVARAWARGVAEASPAGGGAPHVPWSQRIPAAEWRAYEAVLSRARAAGIPFAIGGGFAFSYYARRWRNTKDIDLYIRPQDREGMIGAIQAAGFHDYFGEESYDRAWIFRGKRGQVICDTMWAMANQHAQVDDAWLTRGPEVELHGMTVRLLPPEELIWAKLYVVQRDRCDWPDLLNVLHGAAERIDWQYLLARVNGDARVLGGLVNLFAWMCPEEAARLPQWIWAPLGLRAPQSEAAGEADGRVRLLDTREWFGFTDPDPDARPAGKRPAHAAREDHGHDRRSDEPPAARRGG